jgi:hypothetical protein
MIRLEAATVMLQWSVGGLFFLWYTTRRNEVGAGYALLLRGTFGVFAAIAVVLGFRYGVVPVREASGIAVAVASLVLIRNKRSKLDLITPLLVSLASWLRGWPPSKMWILEVSVCRYFGCSLVRHFLVQ